MGKTHKKFGESRMCSSGHMIADKHTERDRQTRSSQYSALPMRGRSNKYFQAYGKNHGKTIEDILKTFLTEYIAWIHTATPDTTHTAWTV